MEQEKIRLPNHKRLIQQLNSLRYKLSKTGKIIFSSPDKSTIHDDMLWALALPCHAAKLDRSKPIILIGW